MVRKSRSKDSSLSEHDLRVGKVAGAICNALLKHPKLKESCLILTPTITYKVKKRLFEIPNEQVLSSAQIKDLAKKILISIVPVLESHEIGSDVVRNVGPEIEYAALKALKKMSG